MKKIILLTLVTAFFISCQSDDASVVNEESQQQQPPTEEPQEPEEPQAPAQPVAVAFEEVSRGNFQNYSHMFVLQMGNFVLNNSAEWDAFLTYPNVNQLAPLNVTPNFTLNTYIAVRHGFKSDLNENIKIYVQSISQFEGTITVKFVKTDAEPGQVMFPIEGQPYQIVSIPHTTIPIIFEQVNE